jgi:hypothetical protein
MVVGRRLGLSFGQVVWTGPEGGPLRPVLVVLEDSKNRVAEFGTIEPDGTHKVLCEEAKP